MASVNNIPLAEATITGNDTGETKSTEVYQSNFIAVLNVSAIAGGTVAGVVEHSFDGSNWLTLATFAGLGATGTEIQQITDNVGPMVRSDLTYAGATADVKVDLFYDKRK